MAELKDGLKMENQSEAENSLRRVNNMPDINANIDYRGSDADRIE